MGGSPGRSPRAARREPDQCELFRETKEAEAVDLDLGDEAWYVYNDALKDASATICVADGIAATSLTSEMAEPAAKDALTALSAKVVESLQGG